MAIKSVEERLKELEEANKSKLDESLNTSNSNFDAQKTTVTNNYNTQVDKVNEEYQSLYDQNAVQKLINEREIAENMANLGLTDSGLNRTQQTAVQLSYANNKNKFDVAKQKSLDSLAAQLAENISQIDISKSNAAQTIKDNWNQQNMKYAIEGYNTDVEAETARYKAEQDRLLNIEKARIAEETARQKAYYSSLQKQSEAQAKAEKEASYMIKANGGLLRYDYKGSLRDMGVSVIYDRNKGTTTYVDNNSGKKTVLASSINPYTGTTNKDVEKGAFENGYQPNNINGVKLKKVGTIDLTSEIGRTQNVFTTDNKTYWTWYGGSNKYVQVKKKGNGWVVV